MWFADINWQDLLELKAAPPFVPKYEFNGDCANFDIYSEEEETQELESPQEYEKYFADF
jgi:hypothetical protein